MLIQTIIIIIIIIIINFTQDGNRGDGDHEWGHGAWTGAWTGTSTSTGSLLKIKLPLRRGGIWIFRWGLKAKLSLSCHNQSNQLEDSLKNFETNLSPLWDSCDTKFTKLWHKFNTILTHLWQNLDTSLRNFLDYFATILVDLRGNFGAAQWLPTSERTSALWRAYKDIFPHEVFRRNTLCSCSVKAYIKCSLLLY